MKNSLKYTTPLIASILVFLFLQIPFFNVFSGVFDEGFLLYNAWLISQGYVPYRDFFMTTTPGSYYLVGYLFTIFGNYMIVTRILEILAVIATLIICDRLFQFRFYWKLIYLTSLALLSVSPARFFFYNDAFLFALLALYFLIKGIETRKKSHFVSVGVLSGVSFIFKQSIGGLLFPALIIGILLVSERKYIIPYISSFIFGKVLFFVPVITYFYFTNALQQAIYYIIFFAGSVKSHQTSFLINRLMFIPIFVVFINYFLARKVKTKFALLLLASIGFISYLLVKNDRVGRLLTYITDPTFYLHTAVFLLPLLTLSLSIRKNRFKEQRIILVSLTSIVFFLSIAASGYSIGPIVAVSPLLIPITIYLAEEYGKTFITNKKVLIILTTMIISTYTFSLAYNPFYTKSLFGTALANNYTESTTIHQTKFIRFTPEQATDVTKVVTYINKNTKPGEKIFCFPYCPGIYYLTERVGASYFSTFWFETFNENDQQQVIEDLKKNNTRFVILQKTGAIETRKELEERRLSVIQKYVRTNYTSVVRTKNFIILERK